MNTKSKYEQHGPEILELYENGKNSSEIAKILSRKYRIKFSKSSIRSFKRYTTQQEQENPNAVPDNKQEQLMPFPDQAKEAIEELFILLEGLEENNSRQKEAALLQEKSLNNLANLEAKYEDSVEKHAILNDTLHEIIIQNKEERRKKINPYLITGGCILTITLSMVVGYNSRRYNNPMSPHYFVVAGYILGGVIAGIGIGVVTKKIKAMWQEKSKS